MSSTLSPLFSTVLFAPRPTEKGIDSKFSALQAGATIWGCPLLRETQPIHAHRTVENSSKGSKAIDECPSLLPAATGMAAEPCRYLGPKLGQSCRIPAKTMYYDATPDKKNQYVRTS